MWLGAVQCLWAGRSGLRLRLRLRERAWLRLLTAILAMVLLLSLCHRCAHAGVGVGVGALPPAAPVDPSRIQAAASEPSPCCVFQPACPTENSVRLYTHREHGSRGLKAGEWFAGHTDSRGRRHGWGIVFTNSSDTVSPRTGWWQLDQLVRAGPVPFRSLCCHLSFRDLLERSRDVHLVRTWQSDGGQVDDQWIFAPSWNDASVRLIARSPQATIMLYRGGVKSEGTPLDRDPTAGGAVRLLLPHGLGNWSTTMGHVLIQGRFVEGRLEGEGQTSFADHSSLQANHFRSGEAVGAGRGRWTWVHGRNRSYEGELYGALPHGAGTLTLAGGGHYVGAWRHGQRYGEWGFEFFRQRSATPAESESDPPLLPPLTSIYGGAWVRGRRSGFGVERFQDGSEYCGTWLRGLQHGTGRLTDADGTIKDGQWKGAGAWALASS
jgi:hypothetical protein